MIPDASFWRPANIMRWLRNQVIRFVGLTSGRILRDPARAGRGCSVAMQAASGVMDRRVVIALTTTPERVPSLVPTLLSLVEQTVQLDRILLALPERSARSGRTYAHPEMLPGQVEVLRCEDTNPSIKLLPALLAEPDALVIAVDEDVIYARDFVKTLLCWHKRRLDAGLGWIGLNIEPGVNPEHFWQVWGTTRRTPVEVDILLGHGVMAIPPGTFDAQVHDYAG